MLTITSIIITTRTTIITTKLNTIKTIQLEAFSAHNDGWTQNGYREQLIEIRDYLNSIENLKLHGEGDA